MGGYIEDPKPKRPPRRTASGDGGDPCDLSLELDLVGLQPDVSSGLTSGAILRVVLVSLHGIDSVVCQTPAGYTVGALAAFRGLAQLINCLKKGVEYEAAVALASKTRCNVEVYRVSP
jgi:hypothetical protein